MMREIKGKMFYKYLTSYLVIFSIPFSVLSIVIYNNAVLNLKDSIESANVNTLEQVKQRSLKASPRVNIESCMLWPTE